MGLLAASDGETKEPAAVVRVMVVGFDYRVDGVDSGSMHEEEKAGRPIGPGTPSWRARLSVTVSS